MEKGELKFLLESPSILRPTMQASRYRENYDKQELFDFINLASSSTYASGKPPEKISERKDFIEYVFNQNNWSYKDSYTGHTKSAGQEVVRYKNEIVWTNSYCGGMINDNTALAKETFTFLKQALSQENKSFKSLRGPSSFILGEWEYKYKQEGDIEDFGGYEEILYKEKVVFFHRTIGGTVDYE